MKVMPEFSESSSELAAVSDREFINWRRLIQGNLRDSICSFNGYQFLRLSKLDTGAWFVSRARWRLGGWRQRLPSNTRPIPVEWDHKLPL